MAIRGFAELVLEEPDIPIEARQEFMRTVISETEQLALLANDTLLITQIETGQFSFRWSEVDLGPFILDAMPMGLSDHSVLLDIPPQFSRIVADADRLRQVLTNLTMNAVKYSPGGGSITGMNTSLSTASKGTASSRASASAAEPTASAA